MFKNLTYKQKFYAIIIGFILLFMASYKKSYKHTIAAKRKVSYVEQKLLSSENSLNDLYQLNNKISSLDNIIGGQRLNPEQVQQKILDFITKHKFKVNVVSIEEAHLFLDNEFLIYSNQIELGGTYQNLIQTLYKIEKSFKNSRVVSTQLYSKKNYRTNSKKLFLKIILQNYEKSK